MAIMLPSARGALGVHVVTDTWNPADVQVDPGSSYVLSNGNLTFNVTTPSSSGVRGSVGHSTGKWYFEVECDSVDGGTNTPRIGVATATASLLGAGAGNWFIQSNPQFYWDQGSAIADGVTLAATNVVQIAVDLGAAKLWFGVNNTWILSGNPAAGTGAQATDLSGTIYPLAGCANCQVTARFALASFSFTPPTGFSAW